MIAAACGSEGGVVALVENYLGFGEDCVVFDFGFSDDGAVIGEKDEFGVTGAEGSKGGLVSKDIFAALHHQGKFAIDVFRPSFLHHRLIK